MKTAVTGASGFVGTALVALLRSKGDEVVAFSGRDMGPDLTDRAAVHAAIAPLEVDTIFHLAAQSHVPTAWSDPITTLRVNVEGTQNVLDAAHASTTDPRVVVVTSAEVYGAVNEADLPIDEAAPLRPNNPYAASKVAASAVTQHAWLGRNQDVIEVRAFNHVGPGQRPSFVCAGLAHRIAAAEQSGAGDIEVGNLEVRRDFSDVRDVVTAYRLLAEHGRAGEVYNVCSGVDRSIGELGEKLIALSTSAMQLVTNPDLLREVDTPIVRGSNAKLVEHTGWSPQITIEQTLADVLAEARRSVAS